MALPPVPTGSYQGQDLINFNLGNTFLPRDYYSLNPYKAPLPMEEEETVTQGFGIPYTNAFTGGGGGGGGGGAGAYTGREYNPESYITNRGYLSGDYIQGTEPEPNKLQKFGHMIGRGIMNFVPGMSFIRGLDKFNTLSPADQEFARQQMSFKEASVFDNAGNLANQDRYGYNKRSLMGNYANVISKRVDIANKRKAEGKELRDIDQYYLDKEEEQNTLTNQMKFNDFIRQRHAANKIREQQKLGIDLYPSGKDIHGGTTTGGATTVAPQHHGDVSRNRGDHQAKSFRSEKKEGIDTKGSGMHGGKHYAHGGRIGYNRGRVVNPGGYQGDEEFEDENIFEFMRDQGVPHGEMAETSPFEMRINELMDEGMSWQEAYEIASQEFATAEGPEESFSQEGIASIV